MKGDQTGITVQEKLNNKENNKKEKERKKKKKKKKNKRGQTPVWATSLVWNSAITL